MLERDISILTRAIEALTKAIKDSQHLIGSPVVEPAPEPEVEPTPAALPPSIDPVDDPAPTLSDPDFRALMLKMSRAGHKDALRSKLAEHNAEKAGDLKGAARESYIAWLVELAERD
tara:strand:+ start:1217 stop:1567 length:351 start_codon:yes stop_codon:yes gene_type:complete